MGNFNFDMAAEFARRRLDTRLPVYLYYHSAIHTGQDVVPATKRLAKMIGIEGDDLLLLLTGAWFHDLGFILINGDTTAEYKSRVGEHEEASIAIARQVLPDFGYSSGEVEVVSGLILATKLPQTPHNQLEELMADADLDSIGREDFWKVSFRLQAELAAFGMPTDEATWYERQLKFLKSHSYFTAAAIQLRRKGKLLNIAELEKRLQDLRQPVKLDPVYVDSERVAVPIRPVPPRESDRGWQAAPGRGKKDRQLPR
jgi:uncharacterized protein